ncbi:response regulator [Mucilaginibacter sp. Bleaf8]|uniref:ATP-binding protein n=1 Tax=Mucilaginibacter sp. Bleaf8 TaxID=2834430 RepID=UPI001BCCD2B6|nr:ATP-binding protein [Mucilaginibacter sp. Bleaf8]MBS7563634.1 response regulator [Mucilaginibacter sp. Bleaf8]
MAKAAGFFNLSIKNILANGRSSLENARIRLLYYGLLLILGTVSVIFINQLVQNQAVMGYITGTLLICIIILFKYLTWKPDWRFVSHALLVTGTMINMVDAFLIFQQVDIISVQLVLLIVIFGFYMLGQKWGMLYSILNVVPIILFMIYSSNNLYIINFRPSHLDQATLILGVLTNFILLVFIHNHFYQAFQTNMRQLKKNSEEQGRLNSVLEAAIDKAEKSSLAKSEFLSTMSHEIRTPLNAVIGMSNLLMMSNPRPDQKENLEILKFSAGNLLAIVNDVLDFNKIESGKIVFENIRFNLAELMQNICGGQKPKAIEKGLNFVLDIDSRVKNKVVIGDPTRLTQVIFNLVSNAIKFTQQGEVHVLVELVEDRHDRVTIQFSVKDTGIGIEKENLNAIFEPFTQESVTTTRQYGGTGLGLAIVKRLLELSGVQMQVLSQPGRGSEFSFNIEFPVSTEPVVEKVIKPQEPVATEQDGESDMSHLNVLVAEDNMVNTMLMKKLFSKWKLKSSFAENGALAVEQVQYGNFDIILMDLQMPVMNGFDAATEIRKLKDPKKAVTPIIALTASALIDIREKVFDSGMNDYVSKPFKPNELREKIMKLTSGDALLNDNSQVAL